jgi:hypothetical protein
MKGEKKMRFSGNNAKATVIATIILVASITLMAVPIEAQEEHGAGVGSGSGIS